MNIFQTYIHKDSPIKVSKNFYEREFFTKCTDYPKNFHPLDPRLIAAAQTLRTFMKCPVYVTSSFRTPACNFKCGGAPDSLHLKGMALDLVAQSGHEFINESISTYGDLFLLLYKCGIKGFGLYKDYLHIDTRPSGALTHNGRSYTFWYN